MGVTEYRYRPRPSLGLWGVVLGVVFTCVAFVVAPFASNQFEFLLSAAMVFLTPLIAIWGIRNWILAHSDPAVLRLSDTELHLPTGSMLRQTAVIQYEQISLLKASMPEGGYGQEVSIRVGKERRLYHIKESHLSSDKDFEEMLKLLQARVDNARGVSAEQVSA